MFPRGGPALEARGFEHFYYGDVREKAKSTAVDLISAQFEQMRANLNWKECTVSKAPATVSAKGKALSCAETSVLVSSVTTPTVKSSKAEAAENRPEWVATHSTHGGKHSPVPSHIVPKRTTHSPSPNQVRTPSPQRSSRHAAGSSVHRELYLHHDMFLTSQDSDVEQVLLHYLHPHAANHPELEHRPAREAPAASPAGKNSPAAGKSAASPPQSEKGANLCKKQGGSASAVPGVASSGSADKGVKAVQHKAGSPSSAGKERTPNPHVQFPERPELVRTLGSSHSLVDLLEQEGKRKLAAVPSPPLHTFRGVRAVSAGKLRGDLHLHHDVFLRSEDDDVISAVRSISRRRQEVLSRYPHLSDEQVDYALKPDVRGARCVVPSHVVKPRDTAASALRAKKVADAIRARSVQGGRGRDRGARSLSPTAARSNPETAGQAAASTEQSRAVPLPVNDKKTDKLASLQVVPSNGDKADGARQVISPTTVAESPSASAASPGGPTAAVALKKKKQQKQFNFQSRTDSARTIDGGAATPPQAAVQSTLASSRADAKLAFPAAKAVAAVSLPQPQQPKQHYQRPLTAAEHAAALALRTKLTAANLARLRDATAGPQVEPHRQMSRALSLLVYNVRAED